MHSQIRSIGRSRHAPDKCTCSRAHTHSFTHSLTHSLTHARTHTDPDLVALIHRPPSARRSTSLAVVTVTPLSTRPSSSILVRRRGRQRHSLPVASGTPSHAHVCTSRKDAMVDHDLAWHHARPSRLPHGHCGMLSAGSIQAGVASHALALSYRSARRSCSLAAPTRKSASATSWSWTPVCAAANVADDDTAAAATQAQDSHALVLVLVLVRRDSELVAQEAAGGQVPLLPHGHRRRPVDLCVWRLRRLGLRRPARRLEHGYASCREWLSVPC